MSEFIASAEIAILPNTRGFRKQLIDELKDATKKPVPIKVVADPAGFAKSLRKVVLDAQLKVKAQVLVEPNMRGFETKLRAGVKAAADRVTARVNVTTGAAGTGTGRGTGGGGRRAKTATEELAAAQEAAAFSRRRVIGDFTAQERRAQSLARELYSLEAAQKAETAAIKEGNVALQAQAAQLQKTQRAAIEKRRGTIVREEQRETAPARRRAEADAAAAAELNAQRALGKEMAKDTVRQNEAKIKAQRELGAAMAADIARESTLRRKAFNDRLREIERLASAEVRRARATPASALIKKDEALQASLNKAKQAGVEIDDAAIGAMNRLEAARAKEAAAQRIAIALTKARRAAERAGLTTTALAIADEERLALDRLATAQANVRAATSEETLSKRRAFGARGLVAQLATFAGLRGAVLSANAAFIAGTVAAIAFGKSVQSAASFTSQLSIFGVTAGATADQMEEVAAAAVRLGQDVTLPGVGAAEAAEAMTNLAKAGLSVEDSLAGARGVLQLATAAQISNAEATELAASALNAFGLAGTEAIRVADVFANSANLAQGSITDVGIALQQAAAVSRQVGVSFEDTVALLTLLARNGIRGSDAGTSLRVAFTRLIAPTKEAAAVLDNLNVAVRDSQGNLRPEVFADIAAAMSGMSRAQQDANAKIIFGVDALRAYSIVAREGLGSLNATRTALEEEGTAADLANARMTGLTGAAENLKNQLSSLGLILGSLVTGPLTTFTNITADLVSILNQTAGGIIGLGKSAKDAFDDLQDLTSIEIGGFEFGPLQALTEPLGRVEEITSFVRNQFSKSLFEARTEVVGLIQQFNKIGGPTQLNQTIGDLRKLQTELQGGDEEAQKFAKSIGALIKEIQDKSADADVDLGEMKLEIPPELLRGEPGALAAKAAKKAFQDEMRKPFEVTLDPTFNLSSRFTQQGLAAFAAAAAAWRAQLRADMDKLSAEVSRATGRLLGLERAALDLDIGGASLQEQLANARRQEAEAARIVRVQERKLAQGAVAEETVRRAKERLKEATELRRGIQEEIKTAAQKAKDDAQDAARDAQKKLDEADQALLDAFAPAERRVQRRIALAEQTPGVRDDIAAARARKQQLLKQIAVIRADFNDRKAAAEEIFKRRQEILDIEDQIRADERSMRDEITANLGKRIELAQLQGNRNAILKAIDRAIADAKIRVRRWKALGLVLLDEQINLARLIKDRKDFLKDLTGGESPDVFVDRLFREAVDQFRRFGSNISVPGQGSGIISPQGARGEFARILTGGGQNIPNLNQSTAQRTREQQLSEAKKQTGYLQIIAGGPKTKFVRGAPIPPEATRVAREISDNVLSGL